MEFCSPSVCQSVHISAIVFAHLHLFFSAWYQEVYGGLSVCRHGNWYGITVFVSSMHYVIPFSIFCPVSPSVVCCYVSQHTCFGMSVCSFLPFLPFSEPKWHLYKWQSTWMSTCSWVCPQCCSALLVHRDINQRVLCVSIPTCSSSSMHRDINHCVLCVSTPHPPPTPLFSIVSAQGH